MMKFSMYLQIMLAIIFIGTGPDVFAHATKRDEQFATKEVRVWRTIIYPKSQHILPMHRHENNRVLVALTDGVLKITNNKGEIHYLHLKKDKAYFLKKDVPNEVHMDENISNHPIKVMVVELLG